MRSNRSSAHLALGEIEQALADAESAIAAKPDWAKGYIRRAEGLAAQKEYSSALEALHGALDQDIDLMNSPAYCTMLKSIRDLAVSS